MSWRSLPPEGSSIAKSDFDQAFLEFCNQNLSSRNGINNFKDNHNKKADNSGGIASGENFSIGREMSQVLEPEKPRHESRGRTKKRRRDGRNTGLWAFFERRPTTKDPNASPVKDTGQNEKLSIPVTVSREVSSFEFVQTQSAVTIDVNELLDSLNSNSPATPKKKVAPPPPKIGSISPLSLSYHRPRSRTPSPPPRRRSVSPRRQRRYRSRTPPWRRRHYLHFRHRRRRRFSPSPISRRRRSPSSSSSSRNSSPVYKSLGKYDFSASSKSSESGTPKRRRPTPPRTPPPVIGSLPNAPPEGHEKILEAVESPLLDPRLKKRVELNEEIVQKLSPTTVEVSLSSNAGPLDSGRQDNIPNGGLQVLTASQLQQPGSTMPPLNVDALLGSDFKGPVTINIFNFNNYYHPKTSGVPHTEQFILPPNVWPSLPEGLLPAGGIPPGVLSPGMLPPNSEQNRQLNYPPLPPSSLPPSNPFLNSVEPEEGRSLTIGLSPESGPIALPIEAPPLVVDATPEMENPETKSPKSPTKAQQLRKLWENKEPLKLGRPEYRSKKATTKDLLVTSNKKKIMATFTPKRIRTAPKPVPSSSTFAQGANRKVLENRNGFASILKGYKIPKLSKKAENISVPEVEKSKEKTQVRKDLTEKKQDESKKAPKFAPKSIRELRRLHDDLRKCNYEITWKRKRKCTEGMNYKEDETVGDKETFTNSEIRDKEPKKKTGKRTNDYGSRKVAKTLKESFVKKQEIKHNGDIATKTMSFSQKGVLEGDVSRKAVRNLVDYGYSDVDFESSGEERKSESDVEKETQQGPAENAVPSVISGCRENTKKIEQVKTSQIATAKTVTGFADEKQVKTFSEQTLTSNQKSKTKKYASAEITKLTNNDSDNGNGCSGKIPIPVASLSSAITESEIDQVVSFETTDVNCGIQNADKLSLARSDAREEKVKNKKSLESVDANAKTTAYHGSSELRLKDDKMVKIGKTVTFIETQTGSTTKNSNSTNIEETFSVQEKNTEKVDNMELLEKTGVSETQPYSSNTIDCESMTDKQIDQFPEAQKIIIRRESNATYLEKQNKVTFNEQDEVMEDSFRKESAVESRNVNEMAEYKSKTGEEYGYSDAEMNDEANSDLDYPRTGSGTDSDAFQNDEELEVLEANVNNSKMAQVEGNNLTIFRNQHLTTETAPFAGTRTSKQVEKSGPQGDNLIFTSPHVIEDSLDSQISPVSKENIVEMDEDSIWSSGSPTELRNEQVNDIENLEGNHVQLDHSFGQIDLSEPQIFKEPNVAIVGDECNTQHDDTFNSEENFTKASDSIVTVGKQNQSNLSCRNSTVSKSIVITESDPDVQIVYEASPKTKMLDNDHNWISSDLYQNENKNDKEIHNGISSLSSTPSNVESSNESFQTAYDFAEWLENNLGRYPLAYSMVSEPANLDFGKRPEEFRDESSNEGYTNTEVSIDNTLQRQNSTETSVSVEGVEDDNELESTENQNPVDYQQEQGSVLQFQEFQVEDDITSENDKSLEVDNISPAVLDNEHQESSLETEQVPVEQLQSENVVSPATPDSGEPLRKRSTRTRRPTIFYKNWIASKSPRNMSHHNTTKQPSAKVTKKGNKSQTGLKIKQRSRSNSVMDRKMARKNVPDGYSSKSICYLYMTPIHHLTKEEKAIHKKCMRPPDCVIINVSDCLEDGKNCETHSEDFVTLEKLAWVSTLEDSDDSSETETHVDLKTLKSKTPAKRMTEAVPSTSRSARIANSTLRKRLTELRKSASSDSDSEAFIPVANSKKSKRGRPNKTKKKQQKRK